MGKIRTFLSLNLNQEEIDPLERDQNALKAIIGTENVRWEDPGKFHMTLRFLGDVDTAKVNSMADIFERLKFDFEKIEYLTDKLGFFPDSKYPNVIYAGLIENGNNTDKLIGFIDKVIYKFGIKQDKKFIPHITLARFNRSKRRKIETAGIFRLEKAVLKFDSFCLMESELTPSGSEYREINKFYFNK